MILVLIKTHESLNLILFYKFLNILMQQRKILSPITLCGLMAYINEFHMLSLGTCANSINFLDLSLSSIQKTFEEKNATKVSSEDQLMTKPKDDEFELFLKALQFGGTTILQGVFRAALELGLFDIMAKAGPGAHLSSSEIASHLPTKNPDAPDLLDRMLRLLASYSVLTCQLVTNKNGDASRLYGLAPICKFFVRNQDGVSIVPSILFLIDKVIANSWYHLKDAVLEGGVPFNKAHGMHIFEYTGIDSRFSDVFNESMNSSSGDNMSTILGAYKGFEDLSEIVDVGGGGGVTLGTIISKYPNIKGINFDLPHVIKDAPTWTGVEHVGGDMFEGIPKGKVILMKRVIHDWGDDQCLNLLKNCYKALPESGKVIVIDTILPEYPESDLISNNIFSFDVGMLIMTPGGRERTEKELEALAKGAGFAASKLVCHVGLFGVIEFYKKMAIDIQN